MLDWGFHTNSLVRICKVPLSRFDSEEQFCDELPGQALYSSSLDLLTNTPTVADDSLVPDVVPYTPTVADDSPVFDVVEYTPTVADDSPLDVVEYTPTVAEYTPIDVVDLLTPPIDLVTPPASPHLLDRSVFDIFGF